MTDCNKRTVIGKNGRMRVYNNDDHNVTWPPIKDFYPQLTNRKEVRYPQTIQFSLH